MSYELMVELIKKYRSRGFVVHPLSSPADKGNSPGKRPLLSGWQSLDKIPQNIIEYIQKGSNLGLVCGSKSSVIVLDFDHELFKNDVFSGGDINTLISGRTNGRGHVYFKYNPMLPSQKHHDLGIEVLSDGSNAVLPPSVHVSGDVYKWVNPDAPIMELPTDVIKNLNNLFHTETELKQIISKCRHCFRDVMKRKPNMHGAEGREYMIAVCTDIKAVKDDRFKEPMATEAHIKMFAKIMYGKYYDENKTLTEWRNINPAKTWKCETLKTKLASYIDTDLCKKCEERKSNIQTKEYKSNGAFDYIDRIIEKNPIHYDKSNNFWIWDINKKCYNQIDETQILLTILRNVADPSIIQSKFKAELLVAARLRGRDYEVKEVPTHWIHVQNGVVDVTTGEVFEPNPDYLFTEPMPHNLCECEDTPTIDKLFESWVGPEKKQLLYEICAYCLYNGYPIHRMFILVGRGRNGKGQFRDLIVRLVGTQNRTATTIEQLINSRFESSRLWHKKIATVGELNYGVISDTAILKMLSGGDPIPAEQKNKTPFEFVNTAKIIVNTNSLPQTADKTDAWYSRCIAIEFPNQYQKGKDIIDSIPQEEYDCLLTKCIKILRTLLERGGFINEGDINTKEKEYERLSNPLTKFVDVYCEKDPNYTEAAWRIFEKYESYCIEKGFRKPTSKKEFNKMLELNYELDKKNLKDSLTGEYQTWVWVFGLRLKDFSVLSNLSDVLLSSPMRELSEEMDKSDKTDKTDNSMPFKSSIQSTYNSNFYSDKNIVTELNTVTQTCGICGQSLNGLSEKIGLGLGEVHPSCKFTPIKIRALSDLPSFMCIDNNLYTLKAGEVKEIPAINAYGLIYKKAVERMAT